MAASDDELAHTATAVGKSGTPAPSAPIGDTLGRYRLERTLGEGGMGVVHAAFDPDLERRVALKVLRTMDGGGEARQRLLREARAMARLTHPNVVTVHEVGTAGDRDYVAMELIDGATLADWLREHDARTSDEIVTAFVAAGRGLAAAHAAGLVHRDFKPHNVLRRRDGRIVVTDFGLARGVETSAGVALEATVKLNAPASTNASQPSSLSGLTATGSVLGTPAYMAPEQWTGGNIGPAADQFAFCVALWEALTGERPFRGDSIEALKAEVERGPADLDASKLPRRLRRTLRRGLDPDPAKRWPSMDALLGALIRAERRPLVALAVGASVLAIGTVAMVALRGHGAPGCEPPSVAPSHVWSSALSATTPPALASTFDAQLTKWTLARATACTAEPTERLAQLRCLDGALARFDVVRQGYGSAAGIHDEDVLVELVDPSACLTPAPPRLGMPATADVIAAFALRAKSVPEADPDAPKSGDGGAAEAQKFADRPGLEPCARAVAMLAVEDMAPEFPQKRIAINEAVATSDQCDDERVRAELLLAAVPYQFELPMIGPKGEAAIRRADAAVQRVAEPYLKARIDFLRGFVASQHERWDEAFGFVDRTVDTFERLGLHRRAVALLVEALELHFDRGEPDDIAKLRATIAKWLPVARALEPKLADQLERDDALARYTNGDVAAAHADLVRLWKPATKSEQDPGKPIEGDVVDREGKPVAGATVAVARTLVGDSIGIPLPIYRLHQGDAHLRTTTSDGNGHFKIDDGPESGAVLAQLGDRRSLAMPIAEHVKLTVAPTRRLSGKVALGGHAATTSMVIVEEDGVSGQHYQLVAPISPDGAFAIDGVPTEKVHIAVATDNRGFGTQLKYTLVPPSQEAVTNLALSLETNERSLVVVARSTLTTPLDTAQIVVLPGKLQFANVGELIVRNLPGIVTQFARHVVGEQIPHDAIDQVHPGDLIAAFRNVPAGFVTACAIGLSGDMMDRALMRRIQAHVAELELKCATVDGDAKVVVVAAPPQKRFD